MNTFNGVGLGLRTEFVDELIERQDAICDFLEIAPENWLGIGGVYKKQLTTLSRRYPIIAHGLSLSLGGPDTLNTGFIKSLKDFFNQFNIRYYSEHLSYCSDEKGQLYDLMPLPFTSDAVHYVAKRIKTTQDILERKIAIENVSYYGAPGKELSEIEFIKAVLEEADCEMLLDVNNVYVNSVNHGYSATDYLAEIPFSRVTYIHIAGHLVESEDLLIDTHGAAVIDSVWDLLDKVYQEHGVFPTLLERDHNVPPLPELIEELGLIKHLQNKSSLGKRDVGKK